MVCPHCNIGIHKSQTAIPLFQRNNLQWTTLYQVCSECDRPIIELEMREITAYGSGVMQRIMVYPAKGSARQPPVEVTEPYRQDFIEASAVLVISAKASAALSRRTLQAVLRDKAGTKKKDLHDQIEEVITSGHLPSHISEGLHAVRSIGNIAAHSTKSTVTGEIVDVEVGEAEWNLDVLESLFDFYFVQPAIAAKRKAELNKKLQEAGKHPIL
jgi:hypothetical protein